MSWLNRYLCFFVMTVCGIGEGEQISCKSLHQLDKSGRVPSEKVIIKIAQPKAITKYYRSAGTIDRHNRICTKRIHMDCNLDTKH